MKVLLVGINSKYIHTCLAVRYLYHFVNQESVSFCEYTINEQISAVTASIYEKKPDVVLFACYIWNITFIHAVSDTLKKVVPGIKILWGGPEVTYHAEQTLRSAPYVDAVIRGEGEETFRELVQNGFCPEQVQGVTYRNAGYMISNEDRPLICDISTIPFPYTDADIEANKGKLIYYESSRGCPFRCSYCLSSTIHSVRYRDIDLVKKELLFFVRHKVPIIKFVDRTFNASGKRTYELLQFMISCADETKFHFEIAADLINDEILALLKTAPKDLFQLEIGVQSTNDATIQAIDRATDFNKIKETVNKLMSLGTIHLHLDLIAGLPYESLEQFHQSFDDVFALKPHVLQLGFLKMLRGTKIRTQKEEFGYQFTSLPPYEILYNKFLSYDDILLLKGVEDIFEKYYNSEVFSKSINYLLSNYESPFLLFYEISVYFKKNGYDKVSFAQKTLYRLLGEFYKTKFKENSFWDYLKYDYFVHNKGGNTPEWSLEPYDKSLIAFRFEFLNQPQNRNKYFPEFEKYNVKDMIKHLRFEPFQYNILRNKKERCIIVFDYLNQKQTVIEREEI